jgi:hypothetical protein
MVSVKVCPNCKANNTSEAALCSVCKTPLANVPVSTILLSNQLPALPVTLDPNFVRQLPLNVCAVMVAGEANPILVNVPNKLYLGRVTSEELQPLLDLTPFGGERLGVSRQHGVLTRVDSAYTVEDLGSSNGTWVNALRLKPYQQHALRSGDLLRLGRLSMFVHFRVGMSEPQQSFVLRFQLPNQNEDPNYSDELTPHTLQSEIAPYLLALENLQNYLRNLAKRPDQTLMLRGITFDPQDRQLKVELQEAYEVVGWLQNEVSAWRDRHYALFRKRRAAATDSSANPTEPSRPEELTVSTDLHFALTELARTLLSYLPITLNEEEKKTHMLALLPLVRTIATSLTLDVAPVAK